MTDDLVKRLRNPELYIQTSWQELLSLAADRIEKLEEVVGEKDDEIEWLVTDVDNGGCEIRNLKSQVKELEDEIKFVIRQSKKMIKGMWDD